MVRRVIGSSGKVDLHKIWLTGCFPWKLNPGSRVGGDLEAIHSVVTIEEVSGMNAALGFGGEWCGFHLQPCWAAAFRLTAQ